MDLDDLLKEQESRVAKDCKKVEVKFVPASVQALSNLGDQDKQCNFLAQIDDFTKKYGIQNEKTLSKASLNLCQRRSDFQMPYQKKRTMKSLDPDRERPERHRCL